jgi:hypothetical protein
MRETQRERLLKALRARGERDVTSEHRTSKYTVMTRTDKPLLATDQHQMFWFIGVAGALRSGPCSSKSASCPKSRARLLIEADALSAPKKECELSGHEGERRPTYEESIAKTVEGGAE